MEMDSKNRHRKKAFKGHPHNKAKTMGKAKVHKKRFEGNKNSSLDGKSKMDRELETLRSRYDKVIVVKVFFAKWPPNRTFNFFLE